MIAAETQPQQLQPAERKRMPAALPTETGKKRNNDWVFRGVILLLLVISVTTAWWSLKFRLSPLLAQSRELSTRVSRLSSEVDGLDRQWPELNAKVTKERMEEAHNQLFADQATLEAWLAALRNEVTPLALDAKADFGRTIPQTPDLDLAVIPTTITVNVQPAPGSVGYETPYRRLLKLINYLTVDKKRADLLDLTINGGPDSISSATMNFHLWAGEETPTK